MGGRHDACPHRQRTTAHGLCAKEFERDTATYHVYDRVYRADFVEGNILRRTAMHGALSFSQEPESLHGSSRGPFREVCALHEPPDISEGAVGVLLWVFDREAEGAYPADLDGFSADLERHVDLPEHARNLRERRPRGDQSAQNHVASGSADGLEVDV